MEVPNGDVLSTALTCLGLNASEISAYQSSLALGIRPASSIAKVAGLNRAHAYQTLMSLKEKGLVEEVTKNSVKHFSPVPPEEVLQRLDTLASKVQATKRRLQDFLPQLSTIAAVGSSSPAVRFLQGSAGLERAWDEITRTPNSIVHAFLDTAQSIYLGPNQDRRWRKQFEKRRRQNMISFRAIIGGTADANLTIDDIPLFKYRVVREPAFGSDILISGTQVAILSREPQQRGLAFQSASFAKAFQAIHAIAWGSSSEE